MSQVEVIRAPKAPIAPPPGAKPKLWKIILENNARIPPSGQFFGTNGETFLLKAGVPAEVPETIINNLNDAVMSEPIKDEDNQKIIGYVDRLRFPYRVLRQPE